MVVIRRGKIHFRERETSGWAQYCFANELVGFPSRQKSKVICESVSVSQFSLSPMIKYALTRCCEGDKSNFCHFSESSNTNLVTG